MRKAILLKKIYKRCKEKTERKSSYLLLLFLFISLNAFPKGYSQAKLTLNFKNTELKKIISFIEKRTDYRFLYQTSEVDLQKKVDISYKGNVSNAVSMLFNDTSVYPVVVNKQIILKPKVSFQQRVISGVVTDEQGVPISDVTVLINRGQRGTVTDANGKYSIAGKSGDKISFIFIGFKEQELIIGKSDTINIVLKEDINFLEEIVLLGYGKKEKSKISTAITTIKGADIQADLQSGASFDRSLGGMVKGLKVTQGGGRPGSGVDINIRGYTSPFSNSSNSPLFVIDGVPIQVEKSLLGGLEYNPLNSVNPDDIESVNILKDAAATSIYGSRGANGVIIIKTKKSKNSDGGVAVDFSVRTTFSKPINTLKYLDADGYKEYVDVMMKNILDINAKMDKTSIDYGQFLKKVGDFESFGLGFNTMGELAYNPSKAEFGKANTNWSDVIYRNIAYTKEYNLSLRGNLGDLNYGLSLRYLDQEGLLKADEYNQYNTRLNLSFSPNEKWEIGANINLGFSKNSTGYVSINNNVNEIANARPDLAVYDEKGAFTFYKAPSAYGKLFYQNVSNPLAQTTKNSGVSKYKTLTGNTYVQYEILKNLKLKGALNIAHFISDNNQFTNRLYSSFGVLKTVPGLPASILNSLKITSPSSLGISNSNTTNIVADFTANYVKTFNKKHGLDILAGVTRTREYEETKRENYEGFDFPNLKYPQYAKKIVRGGGQGLYLTEHGLNSYIGRAMYDYDNKYNLTATIRLDQSSKFAPSNRDAWFPSIAASWNIHNEKFINREKINELKLRLSYGNTGSTNVPSFTFIQKFNAKDNYNGQTAIGLSEELANDNATWEKTTEINAGLDFGVLQNRIRGSVDVYTRRTEGALMPTPHNLDTGTNQYTANFATVDNKGIEADLNFTVVSTDSFHWSLGVNASKNINKLVAFDETAITDSGGSYEIGKEINLIKGYVVEKIYQKQEEIKEGYDKTVDYPSFPGDYKMKDIDGDGKVTRDDLVILGSSQPDLFGGFRTDFQYKGFSLGASFSYSFGAEATRGFLSNPISADPFKNVEEQFAPKHRWSSQNKDAKLPRIGFLTNNLRTSSANVYDASFVRLKGVRLGYDLPYMLLEKLNISSLNIYISGNNLYTWTDFPGLDPEGVGGGAFVNSTQNKDPYPISKSWTLGLNVKF